MRALRCAPLAGAHSFLSRQALRFVITPQRVFPQRVRLKSVSALCISPPPLPPPPKRTHLQLEARDQRIASLSLEVHSLREALLAAASNANRAGMFMDQDLDVARGERGVLLAALAAVAAAAVGPATTGRQGVF